MRHALFTQTALLFSVAVVPAQSAQVLPSSYTLTIPESSFYADSGNELTDGIVNVPVWPDPAVDSPAGNTNLVGWQSSPTIQFYFENSTIDSITVWAADSGGSAGVGLPSTILVSTPDNSFSQLFTVIDPAGSGSTVPLVLSGFSVTTDSLIITATRVNEWTMLSEVQFFQTVPEVSTSALIAFGTFFGFSRRRRN